MKRALLLIGAFAALALLLTVVGVLLPVQHTAAVRIRLSRAPDVVYQAVSRPAGYGRWRSDLDKVEVIDPGPPLRWRETGRNGSIEFLQLEAVSARRIRAEIQGAREQGFGGTWTWELVPATEGGTSLTITERGEVYNPLFRLLSRTIFSPYVTLERYARDLAALLGDDAVPERVP